MSNNIKKKLARRKMLRRLRNMQRNNVTRIRKLRRDGDFVPPPVGAFSQRWMQKQDHRDKLAALKRKS